MTIDEKYTTTARRAAAGSAARSAVVLRKAGEGSAQLTTVWAGRLDDLAAAVAPRVARRITARRVGIALIVLITIAMIAMMLGKRSSRSRAEAPAEASNADLKSVSDQRSAS
jgi:hypothetical protein